MRFETINEIKQIDGVKAAGTDTNLNPLHDESVTFFLKNGYRLISTKHFLGQTIELEPFDNKVEGQPSYFAEIYHENEGFLSGSPQDKIYQRIDGVQKDIQLSSFIENVSKIISNELSQFLKLRHEILPFQVTSSNKLRG